MDKRIWLIFVLMIAIIFISGCVGHTKEQTANETNETNETNIIANETNETINEANETNITGEGYNPIIDPADFVSQVDNKYYPLVPGTTFSYEGTADNEAETNEMIVTNQTKVILGVTTIVIWDRVFDAEGDLSEETYDWYAQDKDGNVWYFGEDSKSYDAGKVVSTAGSWEAGVNNAKPGMIMTANPQIGDSWRQEYLKGEAEDMGEILGISESVTVPSGTYHNCIKTKDWTPLEPDVIENKYYCPDVGVVLTDMVQGGSEKSELVNITTD